MKLYHGTSERALARILKQGIIPRGQRGLHKGNWKHTVLSHPDCVYLTKAYGLYFAMCAVGGSKLMGRPVVLELDTELLNPFCLWPDEDFLSELNHPSFPEHVRAMKRRDRTKWLLERLQDYADNWQLSLTGLGTCCHYGTIPARAITRYAITEPTKQPILIHQALDPSITMLNYSFAGVKYRAMTKWLFNEPLGEDEPPMRPTINSDGTPSEYKLWTPPEHRDGIDVMYLIKGRPIKVNHDNVKINVR